jgi:hypothetical protein
MSDITFLVQGQQIYAHSFLLGARSEVFYDLLFGEERKVHREITLDAATVDYKAFMAFVEFIYTGKAKIDTSSVWTLLHLAHLYKVKGLSTRCAEFVITTLATNNVLEVWAANLVSVPSPLITQKCSEIVKDNVEKVLTLAKTESVPDSVVLALLNLPTLDIAEIDLFRWLAKWAEVRRDCNLDHVFSLVRYTQISKEDLLKVVKPTNLAPSSFYIEALEYHALPDIYDQSLQRFSPRRPPAPPTFCYSCTYSTPFNGNGILAWISANRPLEHPAVQFEENWYIYKDGQTLCNRREIEGRTKEIEGILFFWKGADGEKSPNS